MKEAMKSTTKPALGLDAGSLVSPSDIAEMAGVSRAAVSNWRKRNDDFPELAGGTPAKPLFARAAVVAWLSGRDHLVKADSGEGLVWAALNALRGSLLPDESASLLLSLACARKLCSEEDDSNSSSTWDVLRNRLQHGGLDALEAFTADHQQRDPRWTSLVEVPSLSSSISSDSIGYVSAMIGRVAIKRLGDVVDVALAKTARAKVRDGLDNGFVTSRTSTALANLARAHGGQSIYDPACGIGGALIAAMRAGLKADTVVGHDHNVFAVLQARQRCYLHDLDAEIQLADVLTSDPMPGLKVDVVITEPPFGATLPPSVHIADRRWRYGMPPKKSGDTLWLQHALAHLTNNGRAFVITPASTLTRGGPEKGIRAELLRQGCIETLIALPPRMLPHISANLVVWVLRQPSDASRPDVQFIDATDVTDAEQHLGTWYTEIVAKHALAVPSKAVDVRDLLAADADLNVQRWVDASERNPAEVATAYQDSWTQLYQVIEKIKGASGSLRHFAGTTHARTFTVGELIDQGVLELRQGHVMAKDVPAELQHRVVTPTHVRERAVADNLDEDEVVLTNYRELLTNGGEVLVTTQMGIHAVVDAGGGHIAVSGVHRLQILDRRQISSAFLALVLGGSWNTRFQVGTVSPRADIRLLEVPLVGTAEQSNVWLADLAAQLLAEDAARITNHIAALRTSMLDALRYNVSLPNEKE